MGLAAAYHLLKSGHAVDVYEADDRLGGMAAHFDFGGVSLERYYHFICKNDHATFQLLDELNLRESLRWRSTSMGYFFEGKHYRWGDPLALMQFSPLSLLSRIRYGLHMLYCMRIKNWKKLDGVNAKIWIRRWIGERGWQILWDKLFQLKFHEYSDEISAAWIWARIKRIGTSRKNIFVEELGYLEGGSEALIKRLAERIAQLGGNIFLSCPTTQVHLDSGAVSGITAGGIHSSYDSVISTVPLPLIPQLIPELPTDLKSRYARSKNIGVVCVVHKLAKQVSPHFWVNTNDHRIDVPGIVEFSNLRDFSGQHIVFVPYYMPTSHAKFSLSDADLTEESFGYLRVLNPQLAPADRLATHISRLRYAQPIFEPDFMRLTPSIQTPITGLQIADTSCYYPEDRGISESVRLAKLMADNVT